MLNISPFQVCTSLFSFFFVITWVFLISFPVTAAFAAHAKSPATAPDQFIILRTIQLRLPNILKRVYDNSIDFPTMMFYFKYVWLATYQVPDFEKLSYVWANRPQLFICI